MQIPIDNPCNHCVRVPDPAQCDNKQCKVWQRWFLDRWQQVRGYYPMINLGDDDDELEK